MSLRFRIKLKDVSDQRLDEKVIDFIDERIDERLRFASFRLLAGGHMFKAWHNNYE